MATYSDDQRQALADKGHALPDGSYPIPNRAALADAIQSFGRAKPNHKAALKKLIQKRAKDLDATNLIPDSWQT